MLIPGTLFRGLRLGLRCCGFFAPLVHQFLPLVQFGFGNGPLFRRHVALNLHELIGGFEEYLLLFQGGNRQRELLPHGKILGPPRQCQLGQLPRQRCTEFLLDLGQLLFRRLYEFWNLCQTCRAAIGLDFRLPVCRFPVGESLTRGGKLLFESRNRCVF